MLGHSQLNFSGIFISFWGKYFEHVDTAMNILTGDTAINVLNMGLDHIF